MPTGNSARATRAAMLVFGMLVPASAFAQYYWENNPGEIAGLGGIAVGGGSGTQGTATGSAGVAFSRHGMALIDTLFMPLGNRTIQTWPDRATVNRSYLLDFGLDFHIRFRADGRWSPYGIVGAGLLWNLIRQDTFTHSGVPLVRHFDQFNGALHTGGGLRYYIRENWGIRPEVKVIVSKHTYTSIAVGVFYVTPPNWP